MLRLKAIACLFLKHKWKQAPLEVIDTRDELSFIAKAACARCGTGRKQMLKFIRRSDQNPLIVNRGRYIHGDYFQGALSNVAFQDRVVHWLGYKALPRISK